MARVIKVFPGKDGKVRVAREKTTSGEMVRSASESSENPVAVPAPVRQKMVVNKSGRLVKLPS
ncbi:hypothetical protein PR048_022631, partial [Dryococelus australis]